MDTATTTSYVREPGPNDVVLGRGARITNLPGNVRYRQVIQSRRVEYMSTGRHRLKKQIAREIYATIRHERNGQFLDKVPPEDLPALGLAEGEEVWQPVSEDTAIRKIKQALCEDEAAIPRSASNTGDNNNEEATSPSSRQRRSSSSARIMPQQPENEPSAESSPLNGMQVYLPSHHQVSGSAAVASAVANGAAVAASNVMLMNQQIQRVQQQQQQALINQQLVVQRHHRQQQLLLAELANQQQQQQLRNALFVLHAQQQQQQQLHQQLGGGGLAMSMLPNNLIGSLGQLNPLLQLPNLPASQSLFSLMGGVSVNPQQLSSLLSIPNAQQLLAAPTFNNGLAALANPAYQLLNNNASFTGDVSSFLPGLSSAASAAMPNMLSLFNPQASVPPSLPTAFNGLAAGPATPMAALSSSSTRPSHDATSTQNNNDEGRQHDEEVNNNNPTDTTSVPVPSGSRRNNDQHQEERSSTEHRRKKRRKSTEK